MVAQQLEPVAPRLELGVTSQEAPSLLFAPEALQGAAEIEEGAGVIGCGGQGAAKCLLGGREVPTVSLHEPDLVPCVGSRGTGRALGCPPE